MEKILGKYKHVQITLTDIVDDPSAFFTLTVQDQTLRREINDLLILQKVVNQAVNQLLRER